MSKLLNKSHFIFLFLFVFATIWVLHLASIVTVAPMDNFEQLIWMRSLEWGYFKHPPITTWLMWVMVELVGWNQWATYLLGAICTMATVFFYWHLMLQIKGPRFAIVALCSALCITFFNSSLLIYNHNVPVALCIAITAWIWYRLSVKHSLVLWFFLGAISAIGLMSKYQYVLVIGTGLVWVIINQIWRSSLHRKGLLLAISTATLLLLPHLIWLIQTDVGPLHYARTVLAEPAPFIKRLQITFWWLMDCLFNRGLPTLALIIVLRYSLKLNKLLLQKNQLESADKFLFLWGIFPMLVMVIVGVGFSNFLPTRWSSPYLMWLIPPMMIVCGFSECQLQRINFSKVLVVTFLSIQTLLIWLSYETSSFGRFPPTSKQKVAFPNNKMATELMTQIKKITKCSVDIIQGPQNYSGSIAILFPNRPKVFVDGNLAINPWIKKDEVSQSVVLKLWSPQEASQSKNLLFNGWAWQINLPTQGYKQKACATSID